MLKPNVDVWFFLLCGDMVSGYGMGRWFGSLMWVSHYFMVSYEMIWWVHGYSFFMSHVSSSLIIFNGDQHGAYESIFLQPIKDCMFPKKWHGMARESLSYYEPVIDNQLLSPQWSEFLWFISPTRIFDYVRYMKQRPYVCCFHPTKFMSCSLNSGVEPH